jgi:peptide/nickel transport system substrate-binding protein
MCSVGYGPDNRLKVKVSARNIAWYRDPAAVLIDQLKKIWIDGELETASRVPKLMRNDFTVVLSLSGSAVDEPDTQFYENYSCRSPRNYTGYCNPEVEALIDSQSAERPGKAQGTGLAGRAQIDRGCGAPIIFFIRQASCWQPEVKGLTLMDNSIFNSWRMEDVWLDR